MTLESDLLGGPDTPLDPRSAMRLTHASAPPLPGSGGGMRIPAVRGSLSDAVLGMMRSGETSGAARLPAADSEDDAQITLWSLYELHYRGFSGVSDDLEWDSELIGLRRRLEQDLEQELRQRAPLSPETGDFAEDFFAAIAAHDGPSLAHFLQRSATEGQMREFLRHKSIYTLKESDHTTWTIPRLSYPVKAAVVELQYDEYGGGNPHRLHANLFAKGLEACGLSAEYGGYIDNAPLPVLVQNNVMSLFGLNRRLRAASLGFLGAFEATSSAPCRRIARGLARLGFPAEIIEYYTEHVEADAVHEQLAVRTVCGGLLEEEPDQYENLWFGAWACQFVDDLYAEHVLESWAV